MARTFAYCRVSTTGQTTENQLREIEAAGFKIEPQRAVTETVSGSVPASQRPGFARLLDRLEAGDILVVSRLDRLGRNIIDVVQTVDMLAARGIKIHCLSLGSVDLSSSAGRMTMSVLAAVAAFERDILIERTQAGLARAKGAGKKLGRPPVLTDAQKTDIRARLANGATVLGLSKELGIDRRAIQRARDAAP